MAETNTGVGSPASEINWSSSLPAIAQLLMPLLGKSGTTTASTSERSTSSANIDPLVALLAQMQGQTPQALEALVGQLFAQGAAKVPELTAQFANATGTRPSNNTMLAQSLSGLNSNLAQTIAQYAVQQQNANNQIAATAGGKIADATKSTATDTNKSVTENAGVNLKNNPALSMGLPLSLLGGFLLNKYGKSQSAGTPGSGPAGASGVSSTSGGETPDLGLFNNPPLSAPSFSGTFDPSLSGFATQSASGAQSFPISGAPDIQAMPLITDTPTFSGTFDPTLPSALPSVSFSGAFDPTLPAATGFDSSAYFSGSFDPSLGAGLDFASPFFLPEADLTDFLGFASGGSTVRNKNQIDRGSVTPASAVNIFPAQVAAQMPASAAPAAQTQAVTEAASPAARTVVPGAATSFAGSPSGAGADGIDQLLEAGSQAFASKAIGSGLVSGFGLESPALSGMIGFDPTSMLVSFAVSQVLKGLFKENGPKPQEFYVQPSGTGIHLGQDNYLQGVDSFYGEAENYLNNSGIYDTAGLQQLSGHRQIYNSPSGTFAGLFRDAEPFRTGNFDNAWFQGFSDRLAQATQTGAYAPAPVVQDIAFASGGVVKSGSGPTADDNMIKVSKGEYILPADVVDYIGIDTLDNFVSTLHTPVNGGTK